MGKKRLYRSLLGIPLWFIVGLSLFVIFSALYDWAVGDRSISRYMILGGSVAILTIAIILHMIKVETVGRVARRQMGG